MKQIDEAHIEFEGQTFAGSEDDPVDAIESGQTCSAPPARRMGSSARAGRPDCSKSHLFVRLLGT